MQLRLFSLGDATVARYASRMALYFGGISAFRFWRSQELSRSAYGRCRSAALKLRSEDLSEIERVCAAFPFEFEGSVHLCVRNASMRRDRRHIAYSVVSSGLGQSAFVRVQRNVYVASPELCYMQMACSLTPVQLMKWGMELCGSYRVDFPSGVLLQRRESLTSVARLIAFLDEFSGNRGARQAKRSARWLMNGSGSPAESRLALKLRVPRRSGGNGLGVPILNHRVALTPTMQKIAGKSCYIVDEYWPDGHLAVEYESDAFHTGGGKEALDRRRRNLVQDMGIRVITVNTLQLKNPMELDNIAAQIAKCIGLEQEKPSAACRARQLEFHRDLMTTDKRYLL